MRKNSSRWVWVILSCCLIMLGVQACNSSKRSSRKSSKSQVNKDSAVSLNEVVPPVEVVPDESVRNLDFKPWFEAQIRQQSRTYQTFSAKLNMTYFSDGDGKDFNGQLRIKKGEAIWFSASALGGVVNIARAMVTPDSIRLINYLSKSVHLYSTEQAKSILPFDVSYENLEKLLMGEVLNGFSDWEVVHTQALSSQNKALAVAAHGDLQQALYMDAILGYLMRQEADIISEAVKVVLNYGNYLKDFSPAFSKDREIKVNNKGQDMHLKMHFKEFAFDQSVDMPFNLPSNYSKK
jgi:hypothetical protein